MDSRPTPAIREKAKFFLLILATFVVVGGFFLKDKWPGQGSRISGSPALGNNIVLMGDQIASGLDLEQGSRLGTQLEKQMGRPLTTIPSRNDGHLSLEDQVSRLGPINPDVVIISLGAGAIVAKEDLGLTLSKIRTVVKAVHQKSAMAVYLEIKPPGVGDNWAMAISQLCNELKMLCVEDIYAGFWDHPHLTLEKMQPPGEANEKAAARIAAKLKGHLPKT